ncbi:MAG TPA: hypothetical protein DEP84_06605 [Chloroflexi bacterium]|nr:hypothetical protein [Chloroflexota bacterium]
MRLFFVQRAAVRPGEAAYASDGTELQSHDLRPTTYVSVFGKVRFERHSFHASGPAGGCPLDAELSLPPRCYSDLLRDWAEYCITHESYDESIKILKRILGLSVSTLALETSVQEDSADGVVFYDQKAVPPPEEEGSILVAQADGKGVPMRRPEPAPRPARRGTGQKRTKKTQAGVTAVDTIEPSPRTPEEVVDALLHDLTGDEEAARIPGAASCPRRPRGASHLEGQGRRFRPSDSAGRPPRG